MYYLQVLNFATQYIKEFETDVPDAIILKQEYADITVYQNIMGELEGHVLEAVTGMKPSTENLTTLIAILAEQLDQSRNKKEDQNNDIINEDETIKGNSPVTLSPAKVGNFNHIVTCSLIGLAGRFTQNSSNNNFQSDNGGHVDQIRRPVLSELNTDVIYENVDSCASHCDTHSMCVSCNTDYQCSEIQHPSIQDVIQQTLHPRSVTNKVYHDACVLTLTRNFSDLLFSSEDDNAKT